MFKPVATCTAIFLTWVGKYTLFCIITIFKRHACITFNKHSIISKVITEKTKFHMALEGLYL